MVGWHHRLNGHEFGYRQVNTFFIFVHKVKDDRKRKMIRKIKEMSGEKSVYTHERELF